MPDPAERFITAAVAPFTDNAELEIVARHQLAATIAQAADAPGDELATLADRLEVGGSPSRRKWGNFALMTLVSAASLIALIELTKDYWKYRVFTYHVIPLIDPLIVGTVGPRPTERDYFNLFGELKPQEKLLLFGDTNRSPRGDRMKVLWDMDPENPVYFAEHAIDHYGRHGLFPESLLEFALRFDPDNAWFPAMAAADAAAAAIDRWSRKRSTSPAGLKLVTVKDRTKLDEAMGLLHEAATKSRYDSYKMELLRQRIPLFPKAAEITDQLFPCGYISGLSTPDIRLRDLADLVSVKAIQLAENEDREGYLELLADWETFTRLHSNADMSLLVDTFIAHAVALRPCKALQEAALQLGLPEEAARMKALDERFERGMAALRVHKDPNDKLAMRSSLIAGVFLPTISSRSVRSGSIPDELLTPGRLADHALAGRLFSAVMWSAFVLALVATALYRFRGTIVTRRLSVGIQKLLRPVDWLWILGIGVVLPIAYYQGISRLTPLGGRDWSLKAGGFFLPAGQYASMLGLVLVLSLLVARRRLGKRAGKIGLAGGGNHWGYLAVLCGAAAMPAFGAALVDGEMVVSTLIAAACLGGSLWLFLVVASIRALFSRESHLLQRVTLSRILMPACMTGMLLMAILMPLYHSEERHWIARETLMTPSADPPSRSRFEAETARLVRQELLDILNHP